MRAPAGRNMFRPGPPHMCGGQLDEIGEAPTRRLYLVERARLEYGLQIEDTGLEAVERVGPDHCVARHARLAGARGDLSERLAGKALAVEAPLAGDDRARSAHALVEAERVEHERRSGMEIRPKRAPQAAGEAAGRAGHRHASRVALEPTSYRVQPRRQAAHLVGVRALL